MRDLVAADGERLASPVACCPDRKTWRFRFRRSNRAPPRLQRAGATLTAADPAGSGGAGEPGPYNLAMAVESAATPFEDEETWRERWLAKLMAVGVVLALAVALVLVVRQ
jgi:hypothetical protein